MVDAVSELLRLVQVMAREHGDDAYFPQSFTMFTSPVGGACEHLAACWSMLSAKPPRLTFSCALFSSFNSDICYEYTV